MRVRELAGHVEGIVTLNVDPETAWEHGVVPRAGNEVQVWGETGVSVRRRHAIHSGRRGSIWCRPVALHIYTARRRGLDGIEFIN